MNFTETCIGIAVASLGLAALIVAVTFAVVMLRRP